MDPLTITATVLRITTTCVGAAKSLNDMRNAWKRAPVTVSSLCSQLKLTSASLSQIQSLLLSDSDILQEKPELVDTFDTTLTSCLVLSTWFENYMNKITKGVLNGPHETWKTRLNALWNESEVNTLLHQLHTQQLAISVLVGLLQMDSLSEIKRLVRRNEALLQKIANNTRKSRSTYSIEAPQSIYQIDNASGSIYSSLPKDKDSEEPLHRDKDVDRPISNDGYESGLLNSKVYTKAVTNIFDHPDAESVNEKTVANARLKSRGSSDGLLYAQRLSHDSRPTLPGSKFIPFKKDFLNAMVNLHIESFYANVQEPHKGNQPGELSFLGEEKVTEVQKVNEHWYWGSVENSDKEMPSLVGLFQRSQVTFYFMLNKHLVVRASKAGTLRDLKSFEGILDFEKGEEFEIDYITSTDVWRGRRSSSQNEEFGLINVGDIELDDRTRKNVDVLLNFFSSPFPDFVGASGVELQRRITTLMRSPTWQPRMMLRLCAHCRSFEELQIFQRSFEACFLEFF